MKGFEMQKLMLVLVALTIGLSSVGTVFGGIFDKAWIKGVTDRSPVSYKVGETMRFELTLQGVTNELSAGANFLNWRRTDDFGLVETGCVDLAQLPFAYGAKLDKPGFVRLEAWVTDAKGKRVGKNPFFDGGAGADVEKLTTEPEPKDFDAFWAKQYGRLDLVPIKADLIEVKCSNPKARKFAVRVDSAGLRPVTGYLSVPKDVDAGATYPAHLFTHGYSADDCRHGTSDKAPHHEIVLDINVHGLKLPEFGGTEADRKALRWEVRSHDCTYAFDAKQNEDPEVAYFNGVVLRVKRALQYLKTVKGWNGKDLVASGGSQGGLQTIWAAACGEGVTRADSGITWCCDMAKNNDRRARKISSDGWYIPWTPSMGYYEAAVFAKRIPATCKTVITRAGLGDYCCPPRGLAVLWNNLTCPKEIHWMQGSQHGYQPPAYKGRDWVLERPSAVAWRDLSGEAARQCVIAAGGKTLPDGYQGHPTTVVTDDGRILCVWTRGHGGPCGPAAESSDGGRTWMRIDARFPKVYAETHANCPTLQKCRRADGGERLLIFSAKSKGDPKPKANYTRCGIMISDDGGRSWREGPVADVSAAMPPTGFMELKDGSLALFGQVRDAKWTESAEPTDDQRIWMSVSKDAGETWGPMRVVAQAKDRNLCEPCCLRSPDGKTLALLLRENRHRDCSMVAFSSDEGVTWTPPVLTAPELTGDRHEALALGDGRYLVCFRDRMLASPTAGQYVGWVGSWEDILFSRPGELRLRLLNHHGKIGTWPGNEWDTGYSGVERLKDGSILCTTYSVTDDDGCYSSVVSTRLTDADLKQ